MLCFLLVQAVCALPAAKSRVSFQTEHFSITVDRGKSQAMPEWAEMLESVWEHHAQFYQFEPKKGFNVFY
jgi:hypothetical protein